MIKQVIKYETSDSELFNTLLAAEKHEQLYQAITKANDAYYKGASLWHALKLIPNSVLFHDLKHPIEELKLINKDYVITNDYHHYNITWLTNNLGFNTIFFDERETGSNGFKRTYNRVYGIDLINRAIKNQVLSKGFKSGPHEESED